ncbi:unnamed protein product [Trifolium pratense]|uniref:Uncharacterized protein n=1 Tax=Trifolium pratense TaxID=57577 RepID=A0ACB0IWP5_TRIPR|nr:unnamed protein product [Trifolium pratense]
MEEDLSIHDNYGTDLLRLSRKEALVEVTHLHYVLTLQVPGEGKLDWLYKDLCVCFRICFVYVHLNLRFVALMKSG